MANFIFRVVPPSAMSGHSLTLVELNNKLTTLVSHGLVKIVTITRLLPSLFFLLLTSASHAADAEIEARVLNATGFIAPGGYDDILIELINPAGSDRIITSVNGSGSRGGYVDYRQPFPVGEGSGPTVSQSLIQSPEGCVYADCLVEGQLPLHPGESLTWIWVTAAIANYQPIPRNTCS